ncbi:hypothetical protein AB1Y20_005750 [Prymnesium parvum]|uniref:EF-hand domain-containing protein n=1 Tax=Prymnesium parvum TaxID=97485 RepID=A0AB34J2Y7_PRYPA|mmetsp:Transcript_9499/g.21160  ORF Transcript_9499/g.21160 Transcript_9499/m.21160 type:complete len:628 (-) Transcript_9499:331-2214(-)
MSRQLKPLQPFAWGGVSGHHSKMILHYLLACRDRIHATANRLLPAGYGWVKEVLIHISIALANILFANYAGGFWWFPACFICFAQMCQSFSSSACIAISAAHHIFLGVVLVIGPTFEVDSHALRYGDDEWGLFMNYTVTKMSEEPRLKNVLGVPPHQYIECPSVAIAEEAGGVTVGQLLGLIYQQEQFEVTFDCKWSFVDTLYFIIATLSTVGYGDIHFANDDRYGQQFLMFYALTGMIVFASLTIISKDAFSSATNSFIAHRRSARAAPVPQHVILLAQLVFLISVFFVLHISSACVFVHTEGWKFSDAFYHCVITATTIGYGDTSATSEAGRIFSTVHMLLSTIYFTGLLGLMSQHVEMSMEEKKQAKLLNARLDSEIFLRLQEEQRGDVDLYNYVVGMLKICGQVDRAHVLLLEKHFDQLDITKDGMLDDEDFRRYVVIHSRRTSVLRADEHRNIAYRCGALKVLYLGFICVPVFFVMHVFAYIWSIASWLQCATALLMIISEGESRLAFLVLYFTIAAHLCVLAMGIWLTVDLRLFFIDDNFERIATFGFDGFPAFPDRSLLAHVFLNGLPKFELFDRLCFLFACSLVSLNLFCLTRFAYKLRRIRSSEPDDQVMVADEDVNH